MIYRKHGKTGKKLSIVGFGGMRFKNIDDRESCVEMILEAARLGINYFDTAPKYFGTKSEETFGEAFRIFRKEKIPFYCSTKTFETKESAIRRELDSQLERLGVETIDFYHIWSVTSLENWRQRKRDGILDTFRKLKEEGLIRHICVSSHLIGDEIKELLDENVFEAVLFGYSAYNFSVRQKAFEAITKHDIGCVVMNPLGGGIIPRHPEMFGFLLRGKDQPENRFGNRSVEQPGNRAENPPAYDDPTGKAIVEAALHFIFSHRRITTALVGFGTIKEIHDAVHAVDTFAVRQGEDVEPEIEEMKTAVTGTFGTLCTGCQYCDDCPVEIPIPKFMEAYNHKLLYGKDEALFNRLKWHWDIPRELAGICTECGQCEEVCTQHIPIIDRLKEIASI